MQEKDVLWYNTTFNKARLKVFLVSSGFALRKSGRSVVKKFFWQKCFCCCMLEVGNILHSKQRRARSPLEANTFVAGDERICLALKTNVFGAGEETNSFKARDERVQR